MMAQEGKTLILKEDFPQRVFYTSLFLTAIIAIASSSFQSPEISLSLLAGCAISLGLCKLQWWTVKRFFQKGRQASGTRPFVWITLLKYSAVCLLFYIIFCHLQVHVTAFLVGIGLVPAVVSLKMAGIVLVNHLNGTAGAQIGGLGE
ncbi:MAG: ATP synthase subunit I [Candidatus Brocadiales bacterium]